MPDKPDGTTIQKHYGFCVYTHSQNQYVTPKAAKQASGNITRRDLPADKIIAVLGNPPNPADISVLSFDLINEVIRHIVENTGPRILSKTLVAPDFDEKIVFNKLNATGYLLRDATYRRGSLEEYFCSNSKFTRQEVRDRLQELYEESKILIFSDNSDGPTSSDQQLFHILDEITPKTQKNNQRLATELQNAALVIMAYFFEACDIFEEPI